jgi:DinB family protein
MVQEEMSSDRVAPSALLGVLSDLQSAEKEASEIIARMSTSQANWRPNDGRSWSIVQCLSHLARTNRIYAATMYEAVARAKVRSQLASQGITPGLFGAWFIRSMEPPVRTRMKARSKVYPVADADPKEALAEFVDSHKPVRSVVEAAAEMDINRIRFKNPFVPLVRFTVGTGLLIISAHDRRHLWQAKQVTIARGFPAS